MITHSQLRREDLEWRAALLGLVACVGLILVQVRPPLHLVLESHCVDHGVGACGEWHGADHADHPEDTELTLAHQHAARSVQGTSNGAHCPYTLTDHPGQVNARASLSSQDTLLSGLAPTAFHLHIPCPTAVSGSQHPGIGPLRTLLQSATAPRGPPCIV